MKTLHFILFLVFTTITFGQEISLVADINTFRGYVYGLQNLFLFNNKLYISSYRETYRYDGVNPWNLAFKLVSTNRYIHNNKLYFASSEVDGGNKLWVYDGFNSPILLADFSKASNAASPSNFCSYDNKLYFAAGDNAHGNELWMYDGSNPPIMIADIETGSVGSNPMKLTVVNNKLYFIANEKELWVYDGINSPNKLTFTFDSYPYRLLSFKNNLYMVMPDSIGSIKLWKYNGINEPVIILNRTISNHEDPIIYNDELIFYAIDSIDTYKIWEYDGINPPAIMQALENVQISHGSNIVFDNKLYIIDDYWYLWVYDGLNAIKKTSARPCDMNITVFKDTLYYTTHESMVQIVHLWKCDGINPPELEQLTSEKTFGSNPSNKRVFNDKLYFLTDDVSAGSTKYKFCKYDGVNQPVKVSDIQLACRCGDEEIIEFNNKLYVMDSRKIWMLDGSDTLKELFDISANESPIIYKDKICFFSHYSGRAAILAFDGINSPEFIAYQSSEAGFYNSIGFAKYNDKIFFNAYDSIYGNELWSFDGINPATIVADLCSGASSSYPGSFVVFKDKLYFVAWDGIHGWELWEYNGIDSPIMVGDLTEGSGSSNITSLTEINNKLYFQIDSEIWEYDGYNKPHNIFNYGLLPLNLSYNKFYLFKDRLLFQTRVLNEYNLWEYKGIDTPTLLISHISNIQILGTFYDKLYYVSNNIIMEYNGFNPPIAIKDDNCKVMNPKNMIPFKSKLYFTAMQDNIGAELFVLSPPDTTIYIQACNSHNFNGTVITSSGIYYDTIPGYSGNDSIIKLNLVVLLLSEADIDATVCDRYISPSGKIFSESGEYKDTIPNSVGCDSIITINLTVNQSTASTIQPKTCGSYTSPSGRYTWERSGTYMDTIPNAAGCDSIITIELNVLNVDPTLIFLLTDPISEIISNDTLAHHQWVNCDDDFSPLAGKTGQSFRPSKAGNYAVIVSYGWCADTSECAQVGLTGISLNSLEQISIYPNPNNGKFTVDLGKIIDEAVIAINVLDGRLVQKKHIEDSQQIEFDLIAPAGIYIVTITTAAQNTVYRIVKN